MSEPLRMCLGCREHKPKHELIRIVRTPSGEILADFSEKLPGRGAYLCNDPACLKKVQKSRALERALKSPVSPEVYERLASDKGDTHG